MAYRNPDGTITKDTVGMIPDFPASPGLPTKPVPQGIDSVALELLGKLIERRLYTLALQVLYASDGQP